YAQKQAEQYGPGGLQWQLGQVDHHIGYAHDPDGIGAHCRAQGIEHKAAKEKLQHNKLGDIQCLPGEQIGPAATGVLVKGVVIDKILAQTHQKNKKQNGAEQ